MSRTLKQVLTEANPNKVAMALQLLDAGKALGMVPRTIRSAVSSNTIVLPDDAKACQILYAIALAGGLTGYLVPGSLKREAAVTTGLVGVNSTGDIAFASADAITSAEVCYIPQEGVVITETVAVASNTGSFTGGRKGAILISATVLTGTALGAKIVDARATAPAAGHAALKLDGTGVAFQATDAVTSATLKYVAFPGNGGEAASLDAALKSNVNF